VFRFLEGLIAGGVQAGLDPAVASELAIQTVLGAATLIEQSGESPEVLRERVSSPGGTTLAALASLESNNFYDSIVAAVGAAVDRSKELGRA
jgi:pyrroline-5-carboxylate reductase